jgi:hypothetical protein
MQQHSSFSDCCASCPAALDQRAFEGSTNNQLGQHQAFQQTWANINSTIKVFVPYQCVWLTRRKSHDKAHLQHQFRNQHDACNCFFQKKLQQLQQQ